MSLGVDGRESVGYSNRMTFTTTPTKPAHTLRVGDTLADGTIVYDIANSVLHPGQLIISSALNGVTGAQIVPPLTLMAVAS